MKKIISLILILTMCFAISSCAVNSENYSLALAAKAMEVKHSDAKQEGYEEFIDKLDAFAAKLTYEIYADSNKQSNICISPVSVYMALALATECANGETRDEILNAVGVTYDEVKNFTKVLYGFSNREYYYTNMMNNKEILAFEELANSIWVDKNTTLKEDGINNLANNFNCDLFSVNFKTSEGEKAINAYIKEKTHGIIDSDIDLSPVTLITLINTFYLKEVWNEDGDELKFTDKAYDFKNADGSVTNTKLLQGYYFTGNIYEGEGYTSFYTSTEHGFDIKFIVPTDGHTLEEAFTSDNIYNINNLGDIVNVLRCKYLIKSMSVGGNDKLYVEAVFGCCVEGSVSISFVDVAVKIIALKQLGVGHATVCVFEIISLIRELQLVTVLVPYLFEIEGVDKRN